MAPWGSIHPMGAIRFTTVPSPVGELTLAASERGLTCLLFEQWAHGPGRTGWLPDDGSAILAAARTQLAEYFDHQRTRFDVPLDLRGTPFQVEVWQALRSIPFGVTISYGELARRVHSKNGFRAVGAANGRNPVAIIVPCHRVIGANGDLTGFGGGIERKRWLLDHERGVTALL